MGATVARRAVRRAVCLLFLFLPVSSVAIGCPFCGVVGQSLAQRRDEAAVVAVGEAKAAAVTDASGVQTQQFLVRQVLRGTGVGPEDAVTARVTAPVTGTAMLFREAGDTGDVTRWSAVAADEALLGHVAAAPAWKDEPAVRLRWYARRLEHPDPAIAADAFTEFGLAPFAAVRRMADAFDSATLRNWVTEPGIDQRRRGFYGLALGVAAATTANDIDRQASVDALRSAIAAPASDFRAGFDGLLAGLLTAEGVAAIDVFERIGLFAPTARPADQKHLLAALRFAWEDLDDTIPRERIIAATARLIGAPVVAADATVDLARQQAWGHAAQVAGLWDTLGGDDPLVRRAVAGYLTACPLGEARQLLEQIRQRDPDRLEAAIMTARLPR